GASWRARVLDRRRGARRRHLGWRRARVVSASGERENDETDRREDRRGLHGYLLREIPMTMHRSGHACARATISCARTAAFGAGLVRAYLTDGSDGLASTSSVAPSPSKSRTGALKPLTLGGFPWNPSSKKRVMIAWIPR